MSTNTLSTETLLQTHPVRMGTRWFLVAPVLMVLLIIAFSPNFDSTVVLRNEPLGGDFLQEWVGGHAIASGQADHLYDTRYFRSLQHDESLVEFQWPESKYFPPVYPPFYYALVSPFSWMPYKVAVIVWAILSVAAFVLTGELMYRFDPETRALVPRWILLGLIFVPLLSCFTMGHKSTILLLILSGTYLLLRNKRPFTAGVVFGLISFKPHLAIVIGLTMLLKGQWRFSLGAIMMACLAAVFSMAVGWQASVDFLQFVLGTGDYVETGGYQLHESHSLWGASACLIGDWGSLPVKVVAGVLSFGVLAAVVAMMRGPTDTQSNRFGVQFAGLVLATVLLSPHFYTYDLVILLLPFLILVSALTRQPINKRIQQWGMCGIVVFGVGIGLFPDIAASTGLQLSVWVLGALLVVIVQLMQPAKPYQAAQG